MTNLQKKLDNHSEKVVHFGTEQAAAQICANPRQTEM